MIKDTLYKHNIEPFKKVMAHFGEGNKKACVISATGTGKAYIGGAVAEYFKNPLVIAPNQYVINQALSVNKNMASATYSWVSMQDTMPNGYDLIWLDEMHRAGAETWGDGINRLLKANPNAYVLGTTATEYRALEKRDMAEELFPNDIVYRLDIVDAWAKNIHRVPKYVIGVKSLSSIEKDYRLRISNAKRLNDTQKKNASAMLDNLLLDWSRSYGVPNIIRKYIDKDVKRMIVFAPTISKIREIEKELPNWFEEAGIKLASIYIVHSAQPTSVANENMRSFENDEREGIKVLLSVDMLNEGVHVDRVDAVMLLRSTISKNLYMQQIGRCFSVGQKHQPIILDLADNLTNACDYDGIYEARDRYIREAGKYKEKYRDERPDYDDDFIIIDTLKDTRDVIGKLSKMCADTRSWDEIATIIDEHYKKTGRLITKKDDESIGAYINMHRKPFYRDKYPERIKFLEERGFVLELPDKYTFETAFEKVMAYKKEHGNFPTSQNSAMKSVKNFMKTGRVTDEQKARLDEVGISRKNYDEEWMNRYNDIKAVYDATGSLISLKKKDRSWIYKQRGDRKLPLTEEKRRLLEAIGAFELEKARLSNMYSEDFLALLDKWFETHEYFPKQSEDKLLYSKIMDYRRKKNFVWDEMVKRGYDDSRFEPKVTVLDNMREFYEKKGRLPINGEKEYSVLVSLAYRADEETEKALVSMGWKKISAIDRRFYERFELFKAWVIEHGYLPSSHRSEEEDVWCRFMNSNRTHKSEIEDFCKDYKRMPKLSADAVTLTELLKADVEKVIAYFEENEELPEKDSEIGVLLMRVFNSRTAKKMLHPMMGKYCIADSSQWYNVGINYQALFKYIDVNGKFPTYKDDKKLYDTLMLSKRHKQKGVFKIYTDRLEALGYHIEYFHEQKVTYEGFRNRVIEHLKKNNGIVPAFGKDKKANQDCNNFKRLHREEFDEIVKMFNNPAL